MSPSTTQRENRKKKKPSRLDGHTIGFIFILLRKITRTIPLYSYMALFKLGAGFRTGGRYDFFFPFPF